MSASVAMIEIHPRRLEGPWKAGLALDQHTVRSTFLGYDEYGHERYDTERSAIGELLYRLKYKGDRSVGRLIVDTVAGFLRSTCWPVDLIVPVPPSNVGRRLQPVPVLAKAVADRAGIAHSRDSLVKVRDTPQLKNVFSFDERYGVLTGAFAVAETAVADRTVLVFDDLYRSGATLGAATQALQRSGKVRDVYVLTLTMTRGRR